MPTIITDKQAKTVAESQVEVRYIVMPSHCNPHNRVFGGMIISWLDMAAAMVAERHSNRPVATISMDRIIFLHPITIGQHVLIKARLNYVGKSSMEIEVNAIIEDPYQKFTKTATTAYLTFVGLDEEGKAHSVPQLKLVSEEEKKRFNQALKRKEKRLKG